MWLQRFMFNIKTRLLQQTADLAPRAAQTAAPASLGESTRAQAIQHRLHDLDQQLARLQSR